MNHTKQFKKKTNYKIILRKFNNKMEKDIFQDIRLARFIAFDTMVKR